MLFVFVIRLVRCFHSQGPRVAVNIDSPIIVTPPAIITQRKTSSPVIINEKIVTPQRK